MLSTNTFLASPTLTATRKRGSKGMAVAHTETIYNRYHSAYCSAIAVMDYHYAPLPTGASSPVSASTGTAVAAATELSQDARGKAAPVPKIFHKIIPSSIREHLEALTSSKSASAAVTTAALASSPTPASERGLKRRTEMNGERGAADVGDEPAMQKPRLEYGDGSSSVNGRADQEAVDVVPTGEGQAAAEHGERAVASSSQAASSLIVSDTSTSASASASSCTSAASTSALPINHTPGVTRGITGGGGGGGSGGGSGGSNRIKVSSSKAKKSTGSIDLSNTAFLQSAFPNSAVARCALQATNPAGGSSDGPQMVLPGSPMASPSKAASRFPGADEILRRRSSPGPMSTAGASGGLFQDGNNTNYPTLDHYLTYKRAMGLADMVKQLPESELTEYSMVPRQHIERALGHYGYKSKCHWGLVYTRRPVPTPPLCVVRLGKLPPITIPSTVLKNKLANKKSTQGMVNQLQSNCGEDNDWRRLVQTLERRWQRENYEQCLKTGLR